MRTTAACLLLLAGCIERPTPPRALVTVDRSTLGDVVLTSAPAVQHPVGAVFNDEVELVGYDVVPEPAHAGQGVQVTFYWRALDDVADDWKVFVHLEDAAHRGQRRLADHYPANGRYHTNAWRKGEVVRDAFTFVAPRDESSLEIWTGLYIGDLRMTLARPGRGLTDGENRVRAGAIVLD